VADAVWRTVEAPRFRPGYIFAIVSGFSLIILCLLLNFLENRDTKRREIENREARQVDVEAPVALEVESPQKLG
jgi:ACS family pantothenate transporter-like MFS transporter